MKVHRNFDAKFKIRMVLETLKNEKTLNQIASDNKISPKNIINWKKHFTDNIHLIFENDRTTSEYKARLANAEQEKGDLYRKIGQLVYHSKNKLTNFC